MPHSIVFAGTSLFAVPVLQALLTDPSFEVVLAITQPDKPAGRKKELTTPPIKTRAMKEGIPVFQPEKLSQEFSDRTEMTKPFDFLVVVSYGQILSEEVLKLPTIAAVNVHASLLPRWRGASPLQHAILAGDVETGVTIQRMVRELDAGPILAQAKIPLDFRVTAVDLHDSLSALGAQLLVQTLKASLHETEQDPSKVTLCRKLTRADGIVDPGHQTAEEIDRRVRALNPWPSVTVRIGDEDLKLLKTSLLSDRETAPFPCAQGTMLYLVSVQPSSKTPMTGAAWARGRML